MNRFTFRLLSLGSLLSLSLGGYSQSHSNDALWYNNGAEVTLTSDALLTVQGDFTTNGAGQSGTHLTNNGFVWVQGNVYGDANFKQAGTGTLRLQNKTSLYAAPYANDAYQVISGGYAVKGGQAAIGAANDGSFFALELDNSNGVVYIKNDVDVRGSVNFKPASKTVAGQAIAPNGVVNRLITHDPAQPLPTTGSAYAAVFGLMNATATLDSLKNNTITANNSLESAVDNGYVQGKLRRAIPAGGATNLGFPLGLEPGTGNGQGVQYARMTFAANTHDVITGYFDKGLSNAATYAAQCNGNPDYFYGTTHGQWGFTSAGNDVTSQYSMSIYPQHYGTVTRESYFITKDNAIDGNSNECGTDPIGLTRGGLTGFTGGVAGFSTFGFAGAQIIYPDLTLTIDIANAIFSPSTSKDFVVNLFELSNVATNGTPVQFRLRKLSNFTITVPQITLSSTPQLGVNTTSQAGANVSNMNGSWNFHEDANYIYVTSLSGYVFPASGFVPIGFNMQRKPNTANGTLNLNIIYTQAANEVNADNNDWSLRINSNN